MGLGKATSNDGNGVMGEKLYLIRKGGAYYRPNCKGYTTSAIQAGRYTLEDADRHSHPNGPDGPRDNLTYIHEKEIANDVDWALYKQLTEALEFVDINLSDVMKGVGSCGLITIRNKARNALKRARGEA